jgi:hypothetical protein
VADVLTWLRDTLNAPFRVPVLSTLFGAVSLLDVLTAVMAVPAAWIVRLMDGAWPAAPGRAARPPRRSRGSPRRTGGSLLPLLAAGHGDRPR